MIWIIPSMKYSQNHTKTKGPLRPTISGLELIYFMGLGCTGTKVIGPNDFQCRKKNRFPPQFVTTPRWNPKNGRVQKKLTLFQRSGSQMKINSWISWISINGLIRVLCLIVFDPLVSSACKNTANLNALIMKIHFPNFQRKSFNFKGPMFHVRYL